MKNYTLTLAFRAQSFYVACAPEAGIWSYGGCFEEAVNALADKLRSIELQGSEGLAKKGTGHAD